MKAEVDDILNEWYLWKEQFHIQNAVEEDSYEDADVYNRGWRA